MNGVHDMGGMHGFGSVDVGDDAQFHADWERAVYAMDKLARARGLNNLDEKRHAIERIEPATYLGSTYFQRWLAALETLLVEKGELAETELREALEAPPEDVPERSDPELTAKARAAFERPADYERPGDEPQLSVGDPVRVRNDHPGGHTRCPRYVRRAAGEITTVHGIHVFPDANAHGEERAEPLYTVGFPATELWGPDAEDGDDVIHVDLWEPYLELRGGDDE